MDEYRELLIRTLEKAGSYISCSHCHRREIDKDNKVIGCQREVPALDNLQCLIKKLFYYELPKEVENEIKEEPKVESTAKIIAEEVIGRPEEKEIVDYR